MIVEEAHDEIVGDEQRSSANDSADDAIILPDDSVLHGIRKSEQNNEIEWIELDEFTFPGEPKTDHQKRINDDRTEDLFQKRKSHNKHIFPSVVHWAMASSR